MHIPENYLSPSTCAVAAAAMAPVWGYCIAKVKKKVTKEKLPLIGIAAAFSFLAMMFNIPLPGGTTGHAVGGTFVAILLGPEAACISVSVALLIQALLFGDGGILCFPANCFNIAFVLVFAGYWTYKLMCFLLKKVKSQVFVKYFSAALGSYVGINAAALLTAVEFGIQPYLFTDAAGNAMYCPYPLSVSVPAMMIGHLTLFGLAEVVFTLGMLAFVNSAAPGIGGEQEKPKLKYIYMGMGVLTLAAPLGLLAVGDAWGEWAYEDFTSLVGYVPSGMKGWSLESIFPDYSVGNMPEWIGYIISAVIGCAVLVIVFKLISLVKPLKGEKK